MSNSADTALKDKLKKTLIETLEINNEHPDEDEITQYIKQRFDQAGVAYVQDDFGNIIAKTTGEGDAILLSTHMDIPEPVPNLKYSIEGDVIRSDGNGILGVDPKSGLAVLIEFLCNLPSGEERVPIEVVITRGEEKGLVGARQVDYSLLSAKIGLVLDEDGPVNNVVVQAPSSIFIDATFSGKAAHPREPELGRNALQAANAAMAALPWGYAAEGVTWNIGKFQAGTARNTIPGSATLSGELRSHDNEAAQTAAKHIEQTLKDKSADFDVVCDVETKVDVKGYKHTPDSEIVSRIEEAFRGLDIKPNRYATFGRSDANIFNAHGISTAAIGSGYYNAHQYTEYADLGDMAEIYNFLYAFVRKQLPHS